MGHKIIRRANPTLHIGDARRIVGQGIALRRPQKTAIAQRVTQRAKRIFLAAQGAVGCGQNGLRAVKPIFRIARRPRQPPAQKTHAHKRPNRQTAGTSSKRAKDREHIRQGREEQAALWKEWAGKSIAADIIESLRDSGEEEGGLFA